MEIQSVENGDQKILGFDLLEETLKLTNLHSVEKGSKVNLERALSIGDRLGGHFVTGHIDKTATVTEFELRGDNYYLEIKFSDPSDSRYIIHKGSIAINGISLTVAGCSKSSVWVWIIPHTYKVTNLSNIRRSHTVNIEFDMIGKYVENFARPTE